MWSYTFVTLNEDVFFILADSGVIEALGHKNIILKDVRDTKLEDTHFILTVRESQEIINEFFADHNIE